LNLARSFIYVITSASPRTTPPITQSVARGGGGAGVAAGGRSASIPQLPPAAGDGTAASAAARPRESCHARSAAAPIAFFSPGAFSPGSFPYGDACSISEFSSAPIRIASDET